MGTVRFSVPGAFWFIAMEALIFAEHDPLIVLFMVILRTVYHTVKNKQFGLSDWGLHFRETNRSDIADQTAQFAPCSGHLETIPGIGPITATALAANCFHRFRLVTASA